MNTILNHLPVCLLVYLVGQQSLINHVNGTTCDDEFECYDDTSISNSGGSTECSGLCSCASIDTITTKEFTCSGSRSCQNVDYITTTSTSIGLLANGFMSLSNSNTVVSTNNIGCYGEAACSNSFSTQIDTDLIDCSALNSCQFLNVINNGNNNQIEQIDAGGTFALQNSIIYSNPDIINTYNFYGWFAGYNTNIYCNNNDTCNILCRSNGCRGLSVYYEQTNPNINIDCNDHNGHLCPNINDGENDLSYQYTLINEFDDTFYQTGFYKKFSDYYYRSYDISDLYDDNIFQCSSNTDYSICNGDSDCQGRTLTIINDKSLCCSGQTSCSVYSDIKITGYDAKVLCVGSRSCSFWSEITGQSLGYNNTLECNGYASCSASTIKYIDNVIVSSPSVLTTTMSDITFLGCFAAYSCLNTKFYDIKYIFATGYSSLGSSSTIDNSNLEEFEIHLLGDNSADDLTITCDNSILISCIIYAFNQDIFDNIKSINCHCNIIIIYEPPITMAPTLPTNKPTNIPSITPTQGPTKKPSEIPSNMPSNTPSQRPSNIPSILPTKSPSRVPTNSPTVLPSQTPSILPTASIETLLPSLTPTVPTASPTEGDFLLFQGKMTYIEALEYCEDVIGTTLATISSLDDLEAISVLTLEIRNLNLEEDKDGIKYWIGLNDLDSDGIWYWSSGGNNDWDIWNTENSFRYKGDNSCGQVRYKDDTGVSTGSSVDCDQSRYFVCDSPSATS